MKKNKKIKVANIFLEADEKQYKEIKGDYNHTYYLRTQKDESEIEVFSLDAMRESEYAGRETIADSRTNVSEEVEYRLLLESMRKVRDDLEPEEKLLLDLIYELGYSQDEAAKKTGIPQTTISYKLRKIYKKMRRKMGIE